MKSLIKKNQLMITALAIMIAIAGYLQFADTKLDEDYLTVNDDLPSTAVDSSDIITENYTSDGLLELSEEDLINTGLTEIESLDTDQTVITDDYLTEGMESVLENTDTLNASDTIATPDAGEIPGDAVFTSASGEAILSEAKLIKEQTRAKNKETLMEIIESNGLTDSQKQEAVDTMVRMTQVAEKEAAAEILLEAKGFSDVVVSINGNAADVVVNASELSDVQRAQIEDIVKRKTEIPAENIIISTVVQQD